MQGKGKEFKKTPALAFAWSQVCQTREKNPDILQKCTALHQAATKQLTPGDKKKAQEMADHILAGFHNE